MNHMDVDYYLSKNKYWSQLDAEWGQPVDLDTSADDLLATSARRHAPCRRSTLHLPTFASQEFIQKVKVSTDKPLHSVTDYNDFREDVADEDSSIAPEEKPSDPKPFYFINGNIMSYQSVEHICHEIDAVFRPVVAHEVKTSTLKNASKRSVHRRTIRKKRAQQFPSIIENSLSISNLSFDESTFSSSKLDFENMQDSVSSLSRTPRGPRSGLAARGSESVGSPPGSTHARDFENALSDLSKALRSKAPNQTEQGVNDYIDRVFSVVEDVSRIITSANDDLSISNISKKSPYKSQVSNKRSRTPNTESDYKIYRSNAKVLASPGTPKYAKENEIVKSPNFRALRDFWARLT